MKKVVIMIILLSLMACTTHKAINGGYWSSQNILPWGPDQIIYFQNDSSYYKIYSAVNGVYYEGKWSVKGDTLLLEDIIEVTKTKREFVDEYWMARKTKYIRQGKTWCYIDDISKPKKQRYILKRNSSIEKEDLLKWIFR